MTTWSDLIKEAQESGELSGFEPLEPNDYALEVVEVTVAETSTSKTMFKSKMKVTEGPHEGRFVWDNHVVSPESPVAMSIFFRTMKTHGLDGEFFASNPTNDEVARRMTGATLIGKVTQKEYPLGSGEMRNEVKNYTKAN